MQIVTNRSVAQACECWGNAGTCPKYSNNCQVCNIGGCDCVTIEEFIVTYTATNPVIPQDIQNKLAQVRNLCDATGPDPSLFGGAATGGGSTLTTDPCIANPCGDNCPSKCTSVCSSFCNDPTCINRCQDLACTNIHCNLSICPANRCNSICNPNASFCDPACGAPANASQCNPMCPGGNLCNQGCPNYNTCICNPSLCNPPVVGVGTNGGGRNSCSNAGGIQNCAQANNGACASCCNGFDLVSPGGVTFCVSE